ncbi:thioesterase II family protein [Actinophytocola sp.]|uniref:thioesterase II family protein n=1 Tax=Actinophytocola sp. TaxID=1872138 RepID=UPI00389A3E5E
MSGTTGAPARPEATDWFVRLPPRRTAPVQLVAIPGAGTGCGVMAPLARRVAGELELFAASLPGRLARYAEPARTEFDPLVAELADALPGALDDTRPYVLFGYCSGALLAYGLVRELRRRAARLPARLVVVSFVPPHRVPVQPNLTGLPSAEFWEAILTHGGVPAALGEPEHRPALEPALRADYQLIADYAHVDEDTVLGLPITVVVGAGDEMLDPEVALGWSRYAGDDFTLKVVGGGHWLLGEAVDDIAHQLTCVTCHPAGQGAGPSPVGGSASGGPVC